MTYLDTIESAAREQLEHFETMRDQHARDIRNKRLSLEALSEEHAVFVARSIALKEALASALSATTKRDDVVAAALALPPCRIHCDCRHCVRFGCALTALRQAIGT